MVIYEVNIEVQTEIAGDYRAWLEEHVTEMLQLPGFVKGTLFSQEGDSGDRLERFTVHYVMQSRDMLDQYFKSHADRMRVAALEQFGDKFTANRRILISNQE